MKYTLDYHAKYLKACVKIMFLKNNTSIYSHPQKRTPRMYKSQIVTLKRKYGITWENMG